MNRQWPAVTSWTLVALTLAAIVGDILFGRLASWVHCLAAAAAFAQLCIQRHSQQAVLASAVMITSLAVLLFPAGFKLVSPLNLGAFAALVGSRALARWRLRQRPGPRGYRVLALGSCLFVPCAGLLLRSSEGNPNPLNPGQLLLGGGLLLLAGAMAQVLATPGLVKVIPEQPDDDRPAIAVWLLLMFWAAYKLTGAAPA